MDHVTLAWAVVGNVFLIFATVRRILVIREITFLLNIHFIRQLHEFFGIWYGMPWISNDNLLFAMMNISCAALEISYLIMAYQEYKPELLHTAKTVITVLAMFIMGCYLIFDDYYLTKLSAVLSAVSCGIGWRSFFDSH